MQEALHPDYLQTVTRPVRRRNDAASRDAQATSRRWRALAFATLLLLSTCVGDDWMPLATCCAFVLQSLLLATLMRRDTTARRVAFAAHIAALGAPLAYRSLILSESIALDAGRSTGRVLKALAHIDVLWTAPTLLYITWSLTLTQLAFVARSSRVLEGHVALRVAAGGALCALIQLAHWRASLAIGVLRLVDVHDNDYLFYSLLATFALGALQPFFDSAAARAERLSRLVAIALAWAFVLFALLRGAGRLAARR